MRNINIAAIVAATILLVSVVMGLSFWGIADEKPTSEDPSEVVAKTFAAEKTRYLMREHEGNVAVFNEDGSLYRVFDVSVSLLPEYDRLLLENGIEIEGEEELRARIEDYTS